MARQRKVVGELLEKVKAMLAEGKARGEIAKALNVTHRQIAREVGNVYKHKPHA